MAGKRNCYQKRRKGNGKTKAEILGKLAEESTSMVVAALEKGVAVWTQPWTLVSGDHGLNNKVPYRGINLLTTAAERLVTGHRGYTWLTWLKYKELQEKNPEILIRKGSKGIPIVFWKRLELKDEEGNVILDDEERPRWYLWPKVYNVFNSDCFDNLDPAKAEGIATLPDAVMPDLERAVTDLVSGYKDAPAVEYMLNGKAFYRPGEHEVHIPELKYFETPARAYSTLAHELVHSTAKAMGRTLGKSFGDEDYSYEELVAECGATMLCAKAGYLEQTVRTSAAYLQGWASSLSSHPSWLNDAMSDARKAVEHILGTRCSAYDDMDERDDQASGVMDPQACRNG